MDAIDYRALKMEDVPAGADGIPYHMALDLAVRELKLPVRPGSLRLSPKGGILWVLSEDGRRLLRLAAKHHRNAEYNNSPLT